MSFLRFAAVSIAALLALTGCTTPTKPPPPKPSAARLFDANAEYRLGVGDVISIRIYGGEEEIRLDRVRVNDPGVITFQFGEFTALGKTTRELEAAMVKSMKGGFLVNPRVWINIDEYRPFFVQGQVRRAGAFPFQPGLNVNKAVAVAGGFSDQASRQKIYLIRDQDRTNTQWHVDVNAPVGPGDTIIVEESFF